MEINPSNTTPHTASGAGGMTTGMGNAQRPGERLRQARMLQNMSLAEAAKELHMSENQLSLLEADEYKRLPEATFIRGYLRRYARLLGIDADALVSRFDEIYTSDTGLPSNHALENSPLQQLARINRYRERGSWLKVVSIVFLIALVILAALSWRYWRTHRAQTTVSAPVVQPAETVVLTPPASTGSLSSAIPATTAPPLSSQTSAQSLPLAVNEYSTSGSATDGSSAASADQLVVTFSKPSQAVITDATGKTLLNGVQGSTQPMTLRGSSPFSIQLSEPQGVQVTLNGEERDISPYIVDGKANFRLSN